MLRLFTLVVTLVTCVLFSQAPEFQQQYRQRLGGALDELTREVQRFADDAVAKGLTLEKALAQLHANTDDLARRRADAMIDTMARKTRLERQRAVFDSSNVITRLASLASDLDPTLASGTWSTFKPAMPTTLDGAAAALFGAAVGLLLMAGATAGVRSVKRRFGGGRAGHARA